MKQRKNFRLSEQTIAKLEELVIPGRRTMTDALTLAIDLFHSRAAHDDAVDLLVEELRGLRQDGEKNAATIEAMKAQLEAVAASLQSVGGIVAAIAALEGSIDKLGEHQLQLAEAVNERTTQPVSNGKTGFFGGIRA